MATSLSVRFRRSEVLERLKGQAGARTFSGYCFETRTGKIRRGSIPDAEVPGSNPGSPTRNLWSGTGIAPKRRRPTAPSRLQPSTKNRHGGPKASSAVGASTTCGSCSCT